MADMIVYNVSSYNRPMQVVEAVKSVIDQCDKINVFLNSYVEVPLDLYHKKIKLFMTNNEMGDAYKFSEMEKENGYYFTIDDDIIYPKNYTETMIDAVEKYGRSKVITMHGRRYEKFPIDSFVKDPCTVYHFAKEVKEDVFVHVGGTGVMCIHTDFYKIPFSYFELPNMADIWVAKYAKENNIDIVCAEHQSGFLIPQEVDLVDTLYGKTKNNDTAQTNILNKIYSE